MTKQEYLERIEKVNVKIAKIEKRIIKWGKDLNEEEKEMASLPYSIENNATFKAYCQSKGYDSYFDNIYELRNAIDDKRNALATLEKYQTKLQEIENFEKEDKIEVLVEFLNEWKENAYSWYIRNAERYIELKINHEEALKQYMNKYVAENGEFKNWSMKYRVEKQFDNEYYSSINAFTIEIVGYSRDINKIDFDKLNKALEEEATRKYKDLVHRITNVVGNIEDVANLSIGHQNGEINGFVSGDKGKAKVETISAGGYNIQCFHFRVLVHKIA